MTARDAARPLLVAALREPQLLAGAGIAQWELLLRQARRTDLLAQLALRLRNAPRVEVPPPVQSHLEAATVVAGAQRDEVMREIGHLRRALAVLGVEPVLLKGAAYVAAGLPPAEGRVFSDIDLMLPKPLLPRAEAQLMLNGWATTHHNAYDQRYYREWMHELPPLRHIHRQSVLDLHHAILPETARLRPDPAKLLAAAVPALHCGGMRVLAPVDLVLHSACHLAHNDDTSHLLRDLVDIDLLLRHFGEGDDFWPQLLDRAAELNLQRPLHYVLKQARSMLGTPLPPAMARRADNEGAPPWPLRRLMHGVFTRALLAPHPSMATAATPAAVGLLYVRAHWLRMPVGLLARHLAVKALRLNESVRK